MQPCLSLVLPVPDRKKNTPPFRSRRAVAALAGPGMVERTGQLHTSSTLAGPGAGLPTAAGPRRRGPRLSYTIIANPRNTVMLRRAERRRRLWAYRPLRRRTRNWQSCGVPGASASTGRRRGAAAGRMPDLPSSGERPARAGGARRRRRRRRACSTLPRCRGYGYGGRMMRKRARRRPAGIRPAALSLGRISNVGGGGLA